MIVLSIDDINIDTISNYFSCIYVYQFTKKNEKLTL